MVCACGWFACIVRFLYLVILVVVCWGFGLIVLVVVCYVCGFICWLLICVVVGLFDLYCGLILVGYVFGV